MTLTSQEFIQVTLYYRQRCTIAVSRECAHSHIVRECDVKNNIRVERSLYLGRRQFNCLVKFEDIFVHIYIYIRLLFSQTHHSDQYPRKNCSVPQCRAE